MELSAARVTSVEPPLSYDQGYPGGGLVCVDAQRDVWAVPLHDTLTGDVLLVKINGVSLMRLVNDYSIRTATTPRGGPL